VIIALTSLGIDPRSTEFAKDKGDLLNSLLAFRKEDGGYSHTLDGSSNEIATEQALMAFAAYSKFTSGKGKLYTLTEKRPDYSDSGKISQWAVDGVAKAAAYNLMQGTSAEEKTFDPGRKITRAELTALVIRLLGETPSNSYTDTYKDVSSNAWYSGYVLKAREKGIVKGVSEDEFAPDTPVSREEMAVMIANAYGLSDKGSDSSISDLGSASSWAKQSISSVYSNGIMKGNNGQFDPKEPVSREMAAVIAVRLYEKAKQ
jgi:hypothetical protein